MSSTGSNPTVINDDTSNFVTVTIIATEVCEVDGKVASIVCLISHCCNVVDPHSDHGTVYQQCEASCSFIEEMMPFDCIIAM